MDFPACVSALSSCSLTRDSPITTSAASSFFQQLPEFLCVAARDALFEVSAEAADNAADRRRAEDRRREQNPDQRSDCDASPGAVLGSLLMLVDVDLAAHVLVDDRGVIGAHELLCMQLEQDLVVTPSFVGAPVGRGIDENGSIGMSVSCPGLLVERRRERAHIARAGRSVLWIDRLCVRPSPQPCSVLLRRASGDAPSSRTARVAAGAADKAASLPRAFPDVRCEMEQNNLDEEGPSRTVGSAFG